VPRAEPVFVPLAIAQSTGLAIQEQWAVGLRRMNVDPEPAGTHGALVAAQSDENLVAIVAMHSWVEMGDHAPGHNFFRDLDTGNLVSMDHCSGLRGFFENQPNSLTVLIDLGQLLAGLPAGAGARTAVAVRAAALTAAAIKAIVDDLPTDPVNPWISEARRDNLAAWLIARQADLLSLLTV
jgi:hypothetical protein